MKVIARNHKRQSTHPLTWLLTLILALTISACDNKAGSGHQAGAKKGHSAPRTKGKKPTPVETQSPRIGTAQAIVTTHGTLEPSSDAKISARATGIVKAIHHEEGTDVEAGTLLMTLEDDDQRLRLRQAEQELLSAEQVYTRLDKMRQAGVVPPNEWETAENNRKLAAIEVEIAQLALSYTRILAPFDGRIVERNKDLGDAVVAGESLYRMMAIDPLLLKIFLPSKRLAKLKVGADVSVQVDAIDQAIAGKVHLISPIVDPNSGTLKVTLEIKDYPEGVRPGDFAQVDIVTDQRQQAMLVPADAILEERGDYYVFVNKDGKAERQDIEVGFSMGLEKEVRSGLSPDTAIIVKGHRNISAGVPLLVLNSNTGNDQGENTVQPKPASQNHSPAKAAP